MDSEQSRSPKSQQYDLDLPRFRYSVLLGSIIILLFIPFDLKLIPESLEHDYLISRLGIQVPVILFCLLLTFSSWFSWLRQPLITIAVTVTSLANQWFIYRGWVTEQFAFSYEGTMLYAFYIILVLRAHLIPALTFSVINVGVLGLILFAYPMYGEFTWVNFGFVVAGHVIAFYAAWQLSRSIDTSMLFETYSRIDPLSELLNRRAYQDEAHKLYDFAIRHEKNVSALIFDLDHFKAYNDSLGHLQGDRVIQMQAHILKDVFKRNTDVIGRFGGEEFIVIIADITEEELIDLAELVLHSWQRLSIKHPASEASDHVSCSIGVAIDDPNTVSLSALVSQADTAMYQAKMAGRGQVVLFDKAQVSKRAHA